MIVPTLLRRMRSVTGFFVLLLLVSLASPVGASGSVGTGAIQNGGNGVADGSLVFVQNTGQFDPQVQFMARSADQTIWLARDAVWITYSPSRALSEDAAGTTHDAAGRRANLRLALVGASQPAEIQPYGLIETRMNYYIGNDPASWVASAPVWSGVRYRQIYPGFDLEISGADGRLNWRLVDSRTSGWLVAAQLDVRLRVDGADRVTVEDGAARADTALGVVDVPLLQRDDAGSVGQSRIWMEHPTVIEVSSGAFEIGSPFATMDRTRVSGSTGVQTDGSPHGSAGTLLWSTFLGGNDFDDAYAVAIHDDGTIYVAGVAFSPNFPVTPGLDTALGGASDGFVARLEPDGSGVRYCTYLGGAFAPAGFDDWMMERVDGIAVDGSGTVFLVGGTYSPDFPTTPGAYDTTFNGGGTCVTIGPNVLDCGDAFLARLGSSGQLMYSTFLGGSYLPYVDSGGDDAATAVAVDEQGRAFVTGFTSSWDFPTTMGAYKREYADVDWSLNDDVFVSVLQPGGNGPGDLLYSTYIGGAGTEHGAAIAVQNGCAYVAGQYQPAGTPFDFPTTVGSFDPGPLTNGSRAFVIRLCPSSQGEADLRYASLFGAPSSSTATSGAGATGVAIDADGRVYIGGWSDAADLVTTVGAYDRVRGGLLDAFAAKLNLGGQGSADLIYSTYLGGAGIECFFYSGLAIDASGDIYLTGDTWSTDFPTTPGAYRSTRTSVSHHDAFVARLRPAGLGAADLIYSTYLGGSESTTGTSIDVREPGRTVVAGYSNSADFPTTDGAWDTTFGGGNTDDAFVAELWALAPTTPGVDAYIRVPARVFGPPSGRLAVPLQFGNNGATTASGVTITATLHLSLTYRGDTLGVAPAIDGSSIVWSLPYTLPFPTTSAASLELDLPAAVPGARYPLTVTVSSTEMDALLGDNMAVAEAQLALQVYVPTVLRNH